MSCVHLHPPFLNTNSFLTQDLDDFLLNEFVALSATARAKKKEKEKREKGLSSGLQDLIEGNGNGGNEVGPRVVRRNIVNAPARQAIPLSLYIYSLYPHQPWPQRRRRSSARSTRHPRWPTSRLRSASPPTSAVTPTLSSSRRSAMATSTAQLHLHRPLRCRLPHRQAAIMVYNVLPTWNHDTTKLIHLILHAIALVLGAVEMYCAFKYHNESGIANLYSLHSWLGIGTICLYGIQCIFGFIAFFFPGAAPNVRRGALPWHILFVLFVYILALATSELGFLEKLTFLQSSGLDKYCAEAFLVNFTALVVVIFGASVVVAVVAPARLEEPQGYAPIPEN